MTSNQLFTVRHRWATVRIKKRIPTVESLINQGVYEATARHRRDMSNLYTYAGARAQVSILNAMGTVMTVPYGNRSRAFIPFPRGPPSPCRRRVGIAPPG